MSKLATTILTIFVTVVGLVALYAAVNAGSGLFAIQMATMVLWAAGFLLFIAKRAKRT